MEDEAREQRMTKELFEIVAEGSDPSLIWVYSDESVIRKTSVGNNIMHIALKNPNNSIVEQVRIRCPHLTGEKNMYGDTPIHIAAQMGNEGFVRQVCDRGYNLTLLRMQNSIGHTPLHVALIHNNFNVAKILIDKDPELASIVNNSNEAPLHLVLQYFPDGDHLGMTSLVVQSLLTHDEYSDHLFDKTSPEQQMIMMIHLLLEKDNDVACWRNASGLTPLHKATSLNPAYNLDVIKLMIKCCPQSIEVCDNFGKNILHHLINRIVFHHKGSHFFEHTRLHGLINQQDEQGNTPLVMAVISKDVIMVDLLKSVGGNLFIKNNQGHNAATLIQQTEIYKLMEKGKIMTVQECDAAEHGDVFFLSSRMNVVGEKHFFSARDSERKNYLHKLFMIKSGNVIIERDFVMFIKAIINADMMDQTDDNGDTPLHILAQLQRHHIKIHIDTAMLLKIDVSNPDPALVEKLHAKSPNYDPYCKSPYVTYNYIWDYLASTRLLQQLVEVCAEYLQKSSVDGPLMVQNVRGNTPFHEAIISKNYEVMIRLAELCSNSTLLNNRNETVLHLLATLKSTPSIEKNVLDDIIKNNTKSNQHLLDVEGLSPLMRATQSGNIEFAERMCFACPSLAEAIDPNGQTFWHLLVNLPPTIPFNFANSSFTNEIVRRQLETKDNEGKTPLHLALEHRRFDLAETFLGLRGTLTSSGTPLFLEHLLKIPNKDGITPADLIGDSLYVPPEFENFIEKVSTMVGIRSIWGIPSTQIKDYVNTMGVIAGLLATITFTAAFAVPGGLDQEKGTPLLIGDASFQFFMIADIIAMCLSTMVLFCLLWIMATGNNSKTVVLLDFSIILLLASFYITLVTFMTGLYATTYLAKPWIAIVGLVLCSTLLLLMHKYLLLNLMIPIGKVALISVEKASSYCSLAPTFIGNAFWKVGAMCKRIINPLGKGHRQSFSPRSDLPITAEAHVIA